MTNAALWLLIVTGISTTALIIFLNFAYRRTRPRTPAQREQQDRDMQNW